MIAPLLGVIACLFIAVPRVGAAQEERLLRLKGRTFAFEKIGTLTTFLCEASDKSDDCRWLEQMDLQPQLDWDRLLEKARQKPRPKKKNGPAASGPLASEVVVDQHGGPWIVSVSGGGQDSPAFLRPYSAAVVPDFPGYRIKLDGGKITYVDVLRRREHWEEASQELGLDAETGKPKKRIGGWFQ